MEITDKELLSICNFSNLKIEFADIIAKYKEIQDPNNQKKLIKVVDRYHTISSLLDKETKAITSLMQGNQAALNDLVFRKIQENTDSQNKTIVPIYSTVQEIKKLIPITYEYYEKKAFGNTQGEFLEQWEILYAADTYKIITDFLDTFAYQQNNYVFTFDNILPPNNITELSDNVEVDVEVQEIILSRDFNTNELRKSIDGIEQEVTDKDKKLYEEKVKELQLYPTREEIEEARKLQKNVETFFFCVNLAITLVPLFNDGVSLIKSIASGETALNSIPRKEWLNIVLKKQRKVVRPKRKARLLAKAIKENKMSLKSAFLMKIDYNINKITKENIALFIENERATKVLKEIIRNKKSFDEIIAEMIRYLNTEEGKKKLKETKKDIIKEVTPEPAELTSNYIEKLANVLIKELSSINKDISLSKKEYYKKALENILPFLNKISFMDDEFGILLLRKGKELVVCFKNSTNDSKIEERIEARNVIHELEMMRIFHETILTKYTDEKTKVTVTGSGTGAKLAGLYYFLCKEELNTLKLYTTRDLNLLKNGFIFQPKDIGTALDFNYQTNKEILKDTMNIFTLDTGIVILYSLLIGGGALSIGVLGTFITAKAISLILSTIVNTAKNMEYNKFYIMLCNYGLIKCKHSSNCKKTRYCCKAKFDEIDSPVPIENKEIDKILAQYIKYAFQYRKDEKYDILDILLNVRQLLSLTFDYLKEGKPEFHFDTNMKKIISNEVEIAEEIEFVSDKDIIGLSEEIIQKYYESRNFTNEFLVKTTKTTFFYTLEIKEKEKWELKKYKRIIKKYQYGNSDTMCYFDVGSVLSDEIIESQSSFRFLVWIMKTYSEFNKYMTKEFEGEIFIERGENSDSNIRCFTSLGDLKKDKESIKEDGDEFSFFPYIEDATGNIGKRKNGETTYLNLNKNYIGTVVRSALEEVYKLQDKVEPKFYTYEEAKSAKLIKDSTTEEEYYKVKLRRKQGEESIINTFSRIKDKKTFNKELLLKLFNLHYAQILNTNVKIYYSYKQVLDMIRENNNILEEFYEIKEKEDGEGIMKDLLIGHLTGDGTYDKSKLEYCFNSEDSLKRGILSLNCKINDEIKEVEKLEGDLTPVVDGAILSCSYGTEFPKLKVTSNLGDTIEERAKGTNLDKVGGENIPPFGKCIKKDGDCICPSIVGDWQSVSIGCGSSGKILLTSQSTIKCAIGGKIVIAKNPVKTGNIN